MKQAMVRSGSVHLAEVPAPLVEPGTVLVRAERTCISIGTEMSSIRSSGLPIWRRALKQPQHVKKVFDMAMTEGILKTRKLVKNRLEADSPTGYSGAGVVLEVGAGVDGIVPGDRVAYAGAQCAFHAEVVCIPRNLVVPMPDDVSFDEASSVALGAIALQGVRRATPTLGETFVVIGLGILGQLTVQMLRANGCRVIGVDLDRDRIAFARQHMGMNWGVHPADTSDIQQVERLTGLGADAVIITAASPSDAIVASAFQMCRKKARVVLVGDVGLNLRRADFYVKELDFLISTSYGPGRYDPIYEEEGRDYPLAYVRWTEQRNMAEYLRLIGERKIEVKPMIDGVFPLADVAQAYDVLKAGSQKPLMVLLSYPAGNTCSDRRLQMQCQTRKSVNGAIRVALIGAGGYAKNIHLPNMQNSDSGFVLRAVVSRSGHNAASTARQFGAEYCTTDYRDVLADPDIDAVVIATRHDKHAALALEALMSGKHVLLEKPLALRKDDLERIETFYMGDMADKPVLLTGFNRRFSSYAKRLEEELKERTNPMVINYRMNAGYIPLDHWVHSSEGGGRNLGEACHIYDLFTFLTGARVCKVEAMQIKPTTNYYSSSDNFVASMTFEDGSLATLTYSSLGSADSPKEKMDIYVDGKVISLDDYRSLSISGGRSKPMQSKVADKGQKQELQAFSAAIRGEAEWPIPLWQQLQATEISFEVENKMANIRNLPCQ